MVFELGTTQAFMDQLFTLPMAQIRQINRKVEILRQDPHPDGHQRKLLKHQKHRIYRLRSGDYRMFGVDAPSGRHGHFTLSSDGPEPASRGLGVDVLPPSILVIVRPETIPSRSRVVM